MDRLKTLKPFTWTAVEAQAEELADLIANAQRQGVSSVECAGEIHAVNREILKANGFAVFSENGGTTFTIAWTRFHSASTSCACDPCCCDDTAADSAQCSGSSGQSSNKEDELKKFLSFVLSSLATPANPEHK